MNWLIYQLWEKNFRAEIAKKLLVNEEEIQCDFFGDLRIIRNSIIHDNSSLRNKDIKKIKILKWNLREGQLVITDSMLGDLIEGLNALYIKVNKASFAS